MLKCLPWGTVAALATGVAAPLVAPSRALPEVARQQGTQSESGDSAAIPSEGLWEARLRFGPDARGRLLLIRDRDGRRAEIAGYSVPVHTAGDTVSFALPDSAGSFSGRLSRSRTSISGHWIQPRLASSGNPYASPLTLLADRAGRYVGSVDPLENALTLYLRVRRQPDGALATFIRNPSETSAGSCARIGSSGRARRFG